MLINNSLETGSALHMPTLTHMHRVRSLRKTSRARSFTRREIYPVKAAAARSFFAFYFCGFELARARARFLLEDIGERRAESICAYGRISRGLLCKRAGKNWCRCTSGWHDAFGIRASRDKQSFNWKIECGWGFSLSALTVKGRISGFGLYTRYLKVSFQACEKS